MGRLTSGASAGELTASQSPLRSKPAAQPLGGQPGHRRARSPAEGRSIKRRSRLPVSRKSPVRRSPTAAPAGHDTPTSPPSSANCHPRPATGGPAHLWWRREVVCPTPAQPLVFQPSVRTLTEHTERLQRLDYQVKAWRLAPLVDARPARRGVQFTGAVTMVAEVGDRVFLAPTLPIDRRQTAMRL
jgi:hypothetical protein